MKLMFCKYCGKGYLVNYTDRFCSEECRAQYKREYMRIYMRTYKKPEPEPLPPTNPLLKIHPSKLPYRGEPTRAVKVELPEDRELRRMWEAQKRQEDIKRRFQKRTKTASERSKIAWEHRADRWTEEEDAELIRLISSGMTQTEVAEKMGRTRLSVQHLLKRLRDGEKK